MNKRIIRTLRATDVYGSLCEIFEVTDFINVGTFGDPGAQIEDVPEFVTADGQRLNKISDTEFEIVTTGKMLYVR